MKIAIASDHAGYEYKEAIKEYLTSNGHEIIDFGTDSVASCDYPDFIKPAARAVADSTADRAIVLGGSGNGEAMAANKVAGIRCGLAWDLKSAELSRLHNDANILSLGQRMMTKDMALEITDLWLKTQFEGGRHIKRIKKIEL